MTGKEAGPPELPKLRNPKPRVYKVTPEALSYRVVWPI